MSKPVALLASSFNKDKPLRSPEKEVKTISATLRVAGWETPPVPFSDLDDLASEFNLYGDTILIFHFAGHAHPKLLEFNAPGQAVADVFVEGLSKFMGSFGGLKLIFLNGCSTEKQASFFFNQPSVEVVIASDKPLDDDLAFNFARHFYQNFCGKNAQPLSTAFENARSLFANGKVEFDKSMLPKDPEKRKRHAGIFDENQPGKETYRLLLRDNNPDFGKKSLADWKKDFENRLPPKTTALPTAALAENSYLLCNRGDARDYWRCVLDEKIADQRPDPAFFFLFEKSIHAPIDLANRFEQYPFDLLPEKQKEDRLYSIQWKKMPLPNRLDFRGGDEKFKIRLAEHYMKNFGGSLDATQKRWIPPKLREDRQVIVVHHHLPAADFHPHFHCLLDYYLGDFASVPAHFSSKLVVVFTCSYSDAPPAFCPLFWAAKDDASRFCLSDFAFIKKDDIADWEAAVLGTAYKSDQKVFFDGAAELDMVEAKERLLAHVIAPFNLQNRSRP